MPWNGFGIFHCSSVFPTVFHPFPMKLATWPLAEDVVCCENCNMAFFLGMCSCHVLKSSQFTKFENPEKHRKNSPYKLLLSNTQPASTVRSHDFPGTDGGVVLRMRRCGLGVRPGDKPEGPGAAEVAVPGCALAHPKRRLQLFLWDSKIGQIRSCWTKLNEGFS